MPPHQQAVENFGQAENTNPGKDGSLLRLPGSLHPGGRIQGPRGRGRRGRADGTWTQVLHEHWPASRAGGESARERFDAYLEELRKASGLALQVNAFDDATRNLLTVARVTGKVADTERG